MVNKILSMIKDFLFPPLCPGCGKAVIQEGVLCKQCYNKVVHIHEIKSNSFYVDSVWTLGRYEGGLKTIIRDVKFNHKKERALGCAPFLQDFYYNYYVKENILAPVDYVIPVPVSSEKLKYRGYNQVDLFFEPMIKTISLMIGKQLWLDVLMKKDGTKAMWNLDKESRLANLRDIYYIKAQYLNLKRKL